jgi:hypothetical protein
MKGIGKDNSNSDVIKRNCLLKLVAKSFNEAHAVLLDLDQAGGYRQAKCTYNRMLGSIDMMEAQLSQAAQLGLIETTTRFQDKVGRFKQRWKQQWAALESKHKLAESKPLSSDSRKSNGVPIAFKCCALVLAQPWFADIMGNSWQYHFIASIKISCA